MESDSKPFILLIKFSICHILRVLKSTVNTFENCLREQFYQNSHSTALPYTELTLSGPIKFPIEIKVQMNQRIACK